MNPNRRHAHPLAGNRLVVLYIVGVALLALFATLLEQAAQ